MIMNTSNYPFQMITELKALTNAAVVCRLSELEIDI